MPRKRTTYTLDPRVKQALAVAAGRANLSISRYLENLLIGSPSIRAELGPDFEPLGEARGGDHSKGEVKVTAPKSNELGA